MEILSKLFGSQSLVKLMRIFLFNPERAFDNRDIAKKAKISASSASWGLTLLSKVGFIKKKIFMKEVMSKRSKNKKVSKRRSTGWVLDQTFPYIKPIHALLVTSELLSEKEIEKRLRTAGKLKLLLVAGVFTQDDDSRTDLLIVGDNLKKGVLESSVKSIESDIGTELRYTVFETSQFEYRVSIYDRLVRDILDNPHKKIINKLDI